MPSPDSIKDLSVKDFINTFSVFVVLGAVSSAYFFGQLFKGNPDYWFYHLLGTTVWFIYTLDHLLDGIRLKNTSMRIRHAVHYRYRKPLAITLAVIALTNLVVAFTFLPHKVLVYGLILLGFVAVYLLFVHILFRKRPFYGKEIAISIGVTAGMVLLPGLYGNFEWNFGDIGLLLIYTLFNLTNLLMFAYFDREYDKDSGFGSLVHFFGEKRSKLLIQQCMISLFLVIGLWAFLAKFPYQIYVVGVFLIMLHILAQIMLKEEFYAEEEKYRFWGDFIYLIPGPFYILIIDKVHFF